MHTIRVYIETKDILDKLSSADKERFTQCIFTRAEILTDGTVDITCVLFNDQAPEQRSERRVKYDGSNELPQVN